MTSGEILPLNTLTYAEVLTLAPEDNHRLFALCGKLNEHLKMIEKRLNVLIRQRGHTFSISGEQDAVKKARHTIDDLYNQTEQTLTFEPRDIHMYLKTAADDVFTQTPNADIRLKKAAIIARGENQVQYLAAMQKHDINFGIGPAGTGKTYLAVASAVNALESQIVHRIVLVRPIVEAGEKLGFLPGDIAQKVHPYLQPLYDALYEMMGFEKVNQLMEKGVIELLPLAYMRGRSLNDAFIILDEAQNTTIEQMKMFLTRIGFNSRAVVTGDTTQIDLSNHRESGLVHAIEVLKEVAGIHFTYFKTTDIVRHHLVQRIVEAFEKYDNDIKKNRRNN